MAGEARQKFKHQLGKAETVRNFTSLINTLPKPINASFERLPQLADDNLFATEMAEADKSSQAAKDMLIHAEREAQLIKQRLEEQNNCRKLLQLQQQNAKNDKRLKTVTNKLDKEWNKFAKNTNMRQAGYQDKHGKGDKHGKARNSNALNEWLDEQAGQTDGYTTDSHSDKEYIPDKRDKGDSSHCLIIPREGSIYDIAKDIMEDDNVSICRKTGVMRKRRDRSSPWKERRNQDRKYEESRSRSSGRSRHDEHRTTRQHEKYTENSRQRRSRYDQEEPWRREMTTALGSSRGESTDSEYYFDSSDAEPAPTAAMKSKLKSGIDAKPGAKVKIELTYPHFSLGQTSAFMNANLVFHNLTYEQFLAGEMCTILDTESTLEKKGRIALLHKITKSSFNIGHKI